MMGERGLKGEGPDRRTRQQLLNDLASAKAREHSMFAANEKLDRRARDAERDLHTALVERDDWRGAFKLIMRLVK